MTINRHESKKMQPDLIYETNIYLTPLIQKHLRIVYGLTSLMSDLGGVMSLMISAFGIIFRPFSKFMYYTNAIKMLFLARTRERDLFLEPKKGPNTSKVEE